MKQLTNLVESIKKGEEFQISKSQVREMSFALHKNLGLFDILEMDVEDSRLKMKIEVFLRMIFLEMQPDVILDFVFKEKLYKSKINGSIYKLDVDEKADVEKLKKHLNFMAFHCIISLTPFAPFFDTLFITSDQEEWMLERIALKEGILISYCKNLLDDDCSEFGMIRICSNNDGLIRIG